MRLDTALWRALAVYRLAALLYAAVSMAVYTDTYERPALGWAVLAGMTAWTAAAAYLYSDPRRRGRPLLLADLVLTVSALMSSVLVLDPDQIASGDPTLTVSWAATPVIAWAVHAGWRGGAVAAAVVGGAAVAERGGDPSQATVNSLVLLLLVGTVVGYVVALARRAETAYAQAVQLQAATAERERLSRSVHDGVLQALALVSRRSSDPSLAALAAEQETALRRLVAGPAVAVPVGEADLRALLHGGGEAWLLVEDEPDAVTVSVRDDGPGIPPGRLEQAVRDGRLGVAQSIRGRVEDLGGTVCVESTPGQGTEVELRVPRER